MRSRVSSVVVEETAVLPKTVHELAAVGDLDGIRKLLASAEIGCDTTDDFGNTLLHVAASRGYLLVVRELVQVFKANVSARNHAHLTPLLVSCKFGQTATMHLLIELGANLMDTDDVDRGCVHYAAENGRANAVRYLHRSGLDLSTQDKNGDSPLHLIAAANAVDSVKLVLQLGGRRDVRNKAGLTPDELARSMDHMKVSSVINRGVLEAGVAPQPGEPWFYIPWLAAPLMDGSIFAVFLWIHHPAAWIAANVSIFAVLFAFRARLLPRDGAKFDSPFAFAHIVSLCIVCLVSYFVFFALNLDSETFLALHLLFWVLALAGALCFHHCAAKDPGTVSRAKSGLLSESCPMVLPDYGFCESCRVIRPLRSKHCLNCDCCVLVLDHHCAYLRNCIGRNNQIQFVGFVVCFWMAIPLYITVAFFFMQPLALELYGMDKVGFCIWMLGYLGAHWLFLSSLLSAQISRIVKNKTTAEAINSKINPHRYQYLAHFNRGIFVNFATFFGTPCRHEHLDLEFGKSTADAF